MWALLLAILPHPHAPVVDEVYRLEKNTMYDECGKKVFCQMIGWEESGRVRWWIMAEKGVLQQDLTGRWKFLFDDGFYLRQIESLSFFESHTQHDPEVTDREQLTVPERRPLSSRKRK